jgi:hypothetical protein
VSDEDIRRVEDHLAWEAFRDERDQAVDLLNDAADRIEQRAAEALPGPWVSLDNGWALVSQPDRQDRKTWRTVVSEPGVANGRWMELAAPPIAPFLTGLLRRVATIAEGQENREDFKANVDLNALGLAAHVMGAQPWGT